MAELFCHLLMKVNHVIVGNVYVANMSFYAIRENKVLVKISKLIVHTQWNVTYWAIFQTESVLKISALNLPSNVNKFFQLFQ